VSDLEKKTKAALLSTADGVLGAIGARKPVGARKEPEPAYSRESSYSSRSPSYSSYSELGSMEKFEPTPEGMWDQPCAHCGELDRDGAKPSILLLDEAWDKAEGVAHVLCDAEAYVRLGNETGLFEANRKLRAAAENRQREEETPSEEALAKAQEKAGRDARRAMKLERRERLAAQLGVPLGNKSFKDLKALQAEQSKTLRRTKQEIVRQLVGDVTDEEDELTVRPLGDPEDDVWIVE